MQMNGFNLQLDSTRSTKLYNFGFLGKCLTQFGYGLQGLFGPLSFGPLSAPTPTFLYLLRLPFGLRTCTSSIILSFVTVSLLFVSKLTTVNSVSPVLYYYGHGIRSYDVATLTPACDAATLACLFCWNRWGGSVLLEKQLSAPREVVQYRLGGPFWESEWGRWRILGGICNSRPRFYGQGVRICFHYANAEGGYSVICRILQSLAIDSMDEFLCPWKHLYISFFTAGSEYPRSPFLASMNNNGCYQRITAMSDSLTSPQIYLPLWAKENRGTSKQDFKLVITVDPVWRVIRHVGSILPECLVTPLRPRCISGILVMHANVLVV
ncbi:hypothetical protein CPB84DRAFT_1878060 [Gymnopilus junonius]|uniref:Uncharacterized protein n=1 Tax=Gymnopilus junonius TaxID=109634 RepID=A0A9P5NDH7_GYMJU|nr:hypothetical protein CPB84DRAFT_1878060 [Gymnopilus junonius]